MSGGDGRGVVGLARGGILLALVVAWGAVVSLSGQVRSWPSESPPKALAARDVRFPPYQVKTLANGLQAVVVVHDEQPLVTVRLIVQAGAASDPAGRAGLAALAAALLDQGTRSRRAGEVAEAIDQVGGAIETGVGRDLTYADLFVLKPDMAFALDLLSEIVREPAFAPEEIERQRQQVIAGLAVGAGDPEYVADLVFERLVHGVGPYGLPGHGTPETVRAIGAGDLHAFHQRYFAPNNAIVAVVGDVAAGEAFAAVERAFGPWEPRPVPADTLPDPPEPTRRVVIIDKPDAVQTEIRVGQVVPPRRHSDYHALTLVANILGGGGANRLHRVLRTERGLTYGASADLSALKRGGHVVARTNTGSESTAEALRIILDEFSTIRRERVHERELTEAKTYLTGSYPLAIETPNAIATHVLDHLFYGLPLEGLDHYRRDVSAVTVADLARVARETLRPDRLSIVLVGRAEAFADDLRGVGIGRFERIPLAELDLIAAELRRR